jgi:hypothetical protein
MVLPPALVAGAAQPGVPPVTGFHHSGFPPSGFSGFGGQQWGIPQWGPDPAARRRSTTPSRPSPSPYARSGGGGGQKFSSSYTNFQKLPFSAKLSLLEALEPVSMNPMYMGNATPTEVACCVYVGTGRRGMARPAFLMVTPFMHHFLCRLGMPACAGRLPHHKLDFLEKNRLLEVCVMEYQRLGRPLNGRDRAEVVKAVKEQQPNIYAMIQAAEEVPMNPMPAFAGLPGFTGHLVAPPNQTMMVPGAFPPQQHPMFGHLAMEATAPPAVPIGTVVPAVRPMASVQTSEDGRMFIHDKATRTSRRIGPPNRAWHIH